MSWIGRSKTELDTPALCIDLDRFESNIRKLYSACQSNGKHWRPHAKCHKSPEIGRRLLEAGAIGLTCAKLGEAEVMAEAGIRDLLIANLIVGKAKLERLVALRRVADPIVCVDHRDQVEQLSDAFADANEPLRVLIEVNIGMHRVGVDPGGAALSLAKRVQAADGLRLAGVMGYEGHLLQIEDVVEKAERIHAALDLLTQSADQIRQGGMSCEIVSCGGTGSYEISATHGGVTEIQAGGGIFMDEFYRICCRVAGLEDALTMLTTIVSRPASDRAIMDAGRKSLNRELSEPRAIRQDGVCIQSLSAEHGILKIKPPADLAIGDRVEWVLGYGDFTNLLHRQFYGCRGDRVEAVWPVQAAGCVQ